MSSLEVVAIREFRRFACSYIYPDYIQKIMMSISINCKSNDVTFIPLPQPTIRFTGNIESVITIHKILIDSFIDFFNDQETVKLIRNKVYNNITCDAEKEFINIALQEIQSRNMRYVALLFNVTFPSDNNVYIYL